MIPARLHVILARKASTAVVIRRGPSKTVAILGWDRANDQFSLGQWLRGRIYERRCDLSPDGKYFIYFAMNGQWESRVKGSWTAISQAPYLKAISLWAKGDCWHGGGLFLSAKEYWLNDGYGHQPLEQHLGLQRSMIYPWTEAYGGECPGVYFIRLQRDGWTKQVAKSRSSTTVFEKQINKHWKLRKLAQATSDRPVGRGCYYDEHILINSQTGQQISNPTWEWADVDGSRLVWAADGALYAGQMKAKGLQAVRLLQDFNSLKFAAIAAPY